MTTEEDTQQHEKAYKEWYWNVIVQDALKRIIPLCQSSDKYFNLNGDEKDFIKLVRYLETWKDKYPNMNSNIKRDLEILMNFKSCKKPIAE